MSPVLATLSYQGKERQVRRWQGHALSNGSAFGSFMQNIKIRITEVYYD